MAPADTPGRKKRETNYFELGVQGRRTGITLRDTGVRDEFGLESAEGIFSSPVKQAQSVRRGGASQSDGTYTNSEEMDVAQSSAPEVTEVLSARRIVRTDGRPSLPVSKTPLKTNLAATPRRAGSMGPVSARRSPSRTPGRAATHSPVRRLDFSETEPQPSVERSPRRAHDRTHERLANGSARRKNVYDFPESPQRGAARLARSPLRNVVEPDDDEIMVNGTHEENPLPNMGDDDMGYAQEDETQADEVIEDSQAAKGRRGRKRKSDLNSSQVVDVDVPMPNGVEEEEDAPPQKKRRGRPPKNATAEDVQAEPEPEPERPAKRGRKARDVVEATQDSPVRSPAKSPAKSPTKAKSNTSKKTALSKKDANKKIATRPKASASPTKSDASRPQQRELHITASEENENMQRTRSGRLVYKPLEGWRGERAIFAHPGGVMDIKGVTDLAEIVRVKDATPIKRPLSRRSASVQPPTRGYRPQRRARNVYEEDVDDNEEEPWEGEEGDGVVAGSVKNWDNVRNAAINDDEFDQQLAFAEKRIQPRPTPDNPTFLFTKTLTMPFFGSGVIELPPGGFKGQKNSRRFQFVFFVHKGKVAVNVNGTRFVISKGGMFQVPRGNFYSIANESDHVAKLMFAQGCEPVPQLDQSFIEG